MAWEPDYVDVATLRSYMRIDDSLDDVELAGAISAASRAIDHETNRQFGVVDSAETREYTVRWSRTERRWIAEVDDLMDVSGLVVDTAGGTLDPNLYQLLPRNSIQKGRPYTSIAISAVSIGGAGFEPPSIDITGLWGWTAVPDAIARATLQQADRFAMRRDAPFGVAGSSGDGAAIRLLAKVDADVAVMVAPYARARLRVGGGETL